MQNVLAIVTKNIFNKEQITWKGWNLSSRDLEILSYM